MRLFDSIVICVHAFRQYIKAIKDVRKKQGDKQLLTHNDWIAA